LEPRRRRGVRGQVAEAAEEEQRETERQPRADGEGSDARAEHNRVAAIRQREPATRPATTGAAVTAPAPKKPTMNPAHVSGRP
jgi:hypothetical protein